MVCGKKNGDQKTWVEKIVELRRRRWADQDVDEVFGAMVKDGCHDGLTPENEQVFERLVPGSPILITVSLRCVGKTLCAQIAIDYFDFSIWTKKDHTLRLEGGTSNDLILMTIREAMRRY